ncbi:MAG: hypothetical protein ABS84_08585 [Rubrivivax sp. SCN 71-131]|nr:MAG: hypothetical protein ABS84_08585 [Rubrivivax sp. SCN 71-131]
MSELGSAPPSHHPAISLEAAVALTGRSRRTWWRRIEAGAVTKLPPDARGRTMLAFGEVRAAIALVLDDQEADAIVRADAGQASAQAQVGAMFALAALTALTAVSGDEPQSVARGGGGAAVYWLQLAAAQNDADAMHWLGMLHAAGYGGSDNHEHLALMWIAKAAAQGHQIAREQLATLRGQRR